VDIKETHNKTHPNAKEKKSDNGGDDED
jgi:hypothetical protein